MSEDIVMDDPSNDGSEEPDKGPDSGVCVTSLIDLAACVTAKSISCEEIEQHRPPLDEAMLKKVRGVDTVNPRYNDSICSQRCCH